MKAKFIGLILLTLLTCLLLFLRFQPYIEAPNDSFFNIYGDGFKNYATVMYHVKQDSTYLQYSGMNYPYSDHVLFTDCQPILANSIKWISRNVTDISDYTVAIINLSMLFSFLLCSVFLYLIFIKLKLPVGYSMFVAIAMMFLAPQFHRVDAHYGLAHSFIIPAIIYLLMYFEEKPRWSLSIATGALVVIVAQLHFYHFALCALLITAYFFFHWLRHLTWQKTMQMAAHYAVQVVIPLILLQIWINWGDTVTDRPTLPMGILAYRAFWEGIFISTQSPIWAWVDQKVTDIRNLNMENEAFVGTVATFFALFLLIRWAIGRFKRPFLPFGESPFLQDLFPASLLVLMFSLGFPFNIPGLEGLLDYLGPLRQFRGWGRFGWIFYFGWNIIVWYNLYQLYAKVIQNRWKYVLLGSALGLLALEAFYSAKATYQEPMHDWRLDKTAFEQSDEYWFKNVNPSDYQAVLPIPYYHEGSESFAIGTLGHTLRWSLIPGLHYGIPSLGVFMSRQSYAQTLEKIPIGLHPYRPLNFVKTLPNQKPLLAIVDRTQRDFQFSEGKNAYGYLMVGTKVLYIDELIEVHELSLDAFERAANHWRSDIFNAWNYDKNHYALQDSFWLPNANTQVVYENFDDQSSEQIYQGAGAFAANREKIIPFWEGYLPADSSTCSVWVYLGQEQLPRINFRAWEIDANGQEKPIAHNGTKFDLQVMDNNHWGLVEFPIKVSDTKHRVKLALECKEMSVPKVWVDELLIRPAGVTVYWEKDGWLGCNNLWFRK